MRGRSLPRVLDFFPKTRRGHGSTHPTPRLDKAGVEVRHACPCINPACGLLRRMGGEDHLDQYANVADWKTERGFREDTPLEDCR